MFDFVLEWSLFENCYIWRVSFGWVDVRFLREWVQVVRAHAAVVSLLPAETTILILAAVASRLPAAPVSFQGFAPVFPPSSFRTSAASPGFPAPHSGVSCFTFINFLNSVAESKKRVYTNTHLTI